MHAEAAAIEDSLLESLYDRFNEPVCLEALGLQILLDPTKSWITGAKTKDIFWNSPEGLLPSTRSLTVIKQAYCIGVCLATLLP